MPDMRPRAWHPLSEQVDLERIEWARSLFSVRFTFVCPAQRMLIVTAIRRGWSLAVIFWKYAAVDIVNQDVAI